MLHRFCILIFLVSLLGLGFATRQHSNQKRDFEDKIDFVLDDVLSNYEHQNYALQGKIKEAAKDFSQFKSIQNKAIKIKKAVAEQVIDLKQNEIVKGLDYQQFFLHPKYFNKNVNLINLDSINLLLPHNSIYKSLLESILLRNKCEALTYLNNQTQHTNCGFDFGITSLFNSQTIALDDTLKNEILYIGSTFEQVYHDEGEYQIFINQKPTKLRHKTKYTIAPTKTGKHEYLVEVRDEHNKTVFKHTHHFFVENCKTQNHE